uniref:RNA-directed DNA polymerase n=1 Tax=Photinus pyralis TaxID=7054 RepID=A0A1Y1NHT7_PHOPY
MLRDRVVCGVRSEALQRRLLAEKDLTFKIALNTATAAETADLNALEIRKQTAPVQQLTATTSTYRRVNRDNKEHNSGVTSSGSNGTNNLHRRQNQSNYKPCFRCGSQHNPFNCRFMNETCRFCKKRGHIERVCMQKNRKQQTNAVDASEQPEDDYAEIFTLNGITSNLPVATTGINNITSMPKATVTLNGQKCYMEVDSGAAVSLMASNTFNRIFHVYKPELSNSTLILKDYQGNVIKTVGVCQVEVKYAGRCAVLPLTVIEDNRSSLLGRNWFATLGIKLAGVYQLTSESVITKSVAEVLSKYADIFKNELGKYKGPPVTLPINDNVQPILCKARRVPFALLPKIETELQKLCQQGILEPITHPRWCTPIVPVVKKDSSIRICGDHKQTLNKALRTDVYPIPAINTILSSLAGGKIFAKLDLAQAYQQLEVDDKSAEAQTIITHKGPFRVKRLQFGISVAPQIFQNFMDQRLSGIQGVFPYFDDVLVAGESETQLAERLEEIFKRFQEDGLRLKREKCAFGVKELSFLGFQLTENGLQPIKDKVNAIRNAPAPKNKQELQAFLGMLNFYHNFLKDKATVAEPLHKLLHTNTKWSWNKIHDEAFQQCKNLLSSKSLLVHFDINKPLILTADASPYGVGAVLSHKMSDGTEAPIAFHSRTLNDAQRNYSQLDREALAIIDGLKKFHHYVFGNKFEIRTDHKPLLGIFGQDKATPEIISPRLQRWSLILNSYNYMLKYVPGSTIANADALSRLPVIDNSTPINEEIPQVLMVETSPEITVNAEKIAILTQKDPVLSKILDWVVRGWPNEIDMDEAKPFYHKRQELSSYKKCLLWGNRVVVPAAARAQVLHMLHETHPGIVRMKMLARSHVWWPNMDVEIEHAVKICNICQENQRAPPKAAIHPWEWATEPWSRLHIDFAGPFQGHQLLIVVDAYSKWLEVELVPTTSSSAAIQVLRSLFATHGLPDVIVSDNGTAFTSAEFAEFTKKNGIRHTTSAPYHPSSNGQAERLVQEAKKMLSKLSQGDWRTKLARMLLSQHTTPSTVTGVSPAELLFKRKLRTCLDRIHPDFVRDMKLKQETLMEQSKPPREFKGGDPVSVRNFGDGPKWVPAQINKRTGPLSYKATLDDGIVIRRHTDQIISRRPLQGHQEPPSDVQEASMSTRPSRDRRMPVHLRDFVLTGGKECDVCKPGEVKVGTPATVG